jgi:hypothetical protein
MPLDPLHAACVQPAPKSRLWCLNFLGMKIKSQSALCAVWVLIVPSLRVVTHSMTLCVIRDKAQAVRLCDPQEAE